MYVEGSQPMVHLRGALPRAVPCDICHTFYVEINIYVEVKCPVAFNLLQLHDYRFLIIRIACASFNRWAGSQ